MDYFYTNRSACEYTLLLEDDSIAAYEWYEKIRSVLSVLDNSHDTSKGPSKWLCVKLFTSFRYFDFLTHLPTLCHTLFQICTASCVQILVFTKLKLIRVKSLFYLLSLNTALLVLWLDFTHISPLGYGLSEYSIGFNTVANVYPRSVLGALSVYIEAYLEKCVSDPTFDMNTRFMPKDLLLGEFKREFKLREYIVEPSVFQHVGIQSSFNQQDVAMSDIYKAQYRPFQSYSFNKEYARPIVFDPNYWYT